MLSSHDLAWRRKKNVIMLSVIAVIALDRLMVSHRSTMKVELEKKPFRVFVNYAFAERPASKRNLNFFLRQGVTNPEEEAGYSVDYGIVVNGHCSLEVCMNPLQFVRNKKTVSVKVMHRENVGFDFGAHTAMLHALDEEQRSYDYYIFLNAGVTGPFIPSYMPKWWHWTQAFVDKLQGKVGIVGTSIVCLHPTDNGGGPRVEGFAFGMRRDALQIARTRGTSFQQHPNKLAAVRQGEYNLTTVLSNNGFEIDTLLMSYQGKDWNEESEWTCNDNKHPSRPNSYFGISMHPLETLFHKSQWRGHEPVLGNYEREYIQFQDGAKQFN